MTDSIDSKIDKIKIPLYRGIIGIIYLSYVLAFFGIWYVNKSYIYILNVIVQSFVCFFLMYRFHPFRKQYILRENDSQIIFGSSIILFVNLVFVEIAKYIQSLTGISLNNVIPNTIIQKNI